MLGLGRRRRRKWKPKIAHKYNEKKCVAPSYLRHHLEFVTTLRDLNDSKDVPSAVACTAEIVAVIENISSVSLPGHNVGAI